MTIALRELKTGDKFSCRIQAVAVTGTITVGRDYIYLCQNKKNGSPSPAEKHGHKYAWAIRKQANEALQEQAFAAQAITHFTVTKAVKRETKVEKAVPKKVVPMPAKAPIDTDHEIALTKAKLADLEAKKAQEMNPERVIGWAINKTRNTKNEEVFEIGCGAVRVTVEEAVKVANILRQFFTRDTFTLSSDKAFRAQVKECQRVSSLLGRRPDLIIK